MFRYKKEHGFTLIELMIVVAIIGILAAIAIPNFLTYQLKSRQSEAKTNLQAIKTSSVAFQSERGCYVGMTAEGVATPAANAKTTPVAWGAGIAPTAPGALWCTAVFNGTFNDIGFRPAGNVNYLYGLIPAVVAAPGVYTLVTSCAVATAALANGAIGVGAAGQNNFVAIAHSNLDGDGAAVSVSAWDSALDHGANDCTTGVF